MTIDQLAAESQVPSRTIRFYQSKGALMAPTIQGRVAHYSEAHLERLKLIAQLQDRGLSIDAIRDLCQALDRGEVDLAEWLGVERELKQSWSNDEPRAMSEDDIHALGGVRRPGLFADLVRSGLVERHGAVYLVKSPALLVIALRLEAARVPLDVAIEAGALLGKSFEKIAGQLAELFVKRISDGAIEAEMTPKLLETLRPIGMEAVRVLFGREMERQLRKLADSGKLHKARKAKRR